MEKKNNMGYTSEEMAWVRENFFRFPFRQLREEFNRQFNRSLSENQMNWLAYGRLQLRKGAANGGETKVINVSSGDTKVTVALQKDAVPASTPDPVSSATAEEIVAYVKAHPEMTYREIGDHFGRHDKTVGRYALQAGIVRRPELVGRSLATKEVEESVPDVDQKEKPLSKQETPIFGATYKAEVKAQYEKYFGAVREGQVIVFMDGNWSNLSKENLMTVDRAYALKCGLDGIFC